MTDDEKVRRIVEAWNAPHEGANEFAVRRARELFGKTPEEQAVIEAACQVYDSGGTGPRTGNNWERLTNAVCSLRVSREPKPRWHVVDNRSMGEPAPYCVRDSTGKDGNAWTRGRDEAERIARLLNEADK